jgi:SNF2 family DNA or RNA helicase
LRYLLTGTPFNNGISDVGTLAWLLQDGNAWQETEWWSRKTRLEEIGVQRDLETWRASVLIRGKDCIRQELPSRNEIIVRVEATATEKKFSATLFIKFQEAIMAHDDAARRRENENRFLAWKCILTTLLRMMQMTTHRLILCKNSRNYTHRYSHLSKHRFKPSCVNCELIPDDVPLVIGVDRAREVENLEEWIDNNDDADSDDDSADFRPSRRQNIPRFSVLSCGHSLCAACMQAFRTDPHQFPCQFCVDMREIGMETCFDDIPPPSSKLEVLIEHLRMLNQYQNPEPKLETSSDEFKKPEKAVVFTLFKAALDICEALLRAAGISHIRIDGETPNRTEVISKFMLDDSIHVLLASSRAAGLGLNLTRASTVIFLVCLRFQILT